MGEMVGLERVSSFLQLELKVARLVMVQVCTGLERLTVLEWIHKPLFQIITARAPHPVSTV